jgi:hypothetical protein
MLHREEELRLSFPVQHRFTAAEQSGNTEWMDVAREVQLQVLTEFHYAPTDTNLHALQIAAQKHPNIPMYVRENRARSGNLRVGHDAPNVEVVSLDGSAAHLLDDYATAGRPLVVIAGSYS